MSARQVTVRQRAILDLLQEPGATQRTVADQLGISVQTVKNHLQTVYRTLGVRSLAQAVRAMRKRSPVR